MGSTPALRIGLGQTLNLDLNQNPGEEIFEGPVYHGIYPRCIFDKYSMESLTKPKK